jgi:hypothetical protein
LVQFYNGIENILKRISRHHNVPFPTGETFVSACLPSDLPLLFDKVLASALTLYRCFRHVAFHGYGFQLDWGCMAEGVANVRDLFSQIKAILSDDLVSIGA